jgi:ATP-binding cassette subfamily B protein
VVRVGAPVAGHLALVPAARIVSRRVRVLAPDGRCRDVPAARLADWLVDEAAAPLAAGVEALVAAVPLGARHRRRARRGLLAAHLAAVPGPRAVLLGRATAGERQRGSGDGRHPAGRRRSMRLAARWAAALLGAQAAGMAAWVVLGRCALAGRFTAADQVAWTLLSLTVPLLRGTEIAAAAAVADRLATAFRRWLMAGLLRLPAEVCRAEATGQLLGRVLGAEAGERLLAAGGPALVVAGIELAGAAVALAHGAGAALQLGALAAALAATAALTAACWRRQRACAAWRDEMTGGLVEALSGLRTRRAQGKEDASLGAQGDDDAVLAGYHRRCRRLGWAEAALCAGVPRGFLVAGVAGLAAAAAGMLDGGISGVAEAARAAGAPSVSPGRVAVSLGGLLLAAGGLGRLGAAACEAAAALAAAEGVLLIVAPGCTGLVAAMVHRLRGAGEVESDEKGRAAGAGFVDDGRAADAGFIDAGGVMEVALVDEGTGAEAGLGDREAGAAAAERGGGGALVLEAQNLTAVPPGRSEPVFSGLALEIRRGDRVLLDGASGAGKSTLAALLAAGRGVPGGLLLLRGLDPGSWRRAAWRRRIVAVPQLHANHLFADSLAFNLLCGRGWPPLAGDLELAAAVCRDLGLGGLLDRLPRGLGERIGEAGWQLSDGEGSRVCLARAVLQEPDLLIVDESLATLDPAGRLVVLEALRRRSLAVMVIGHEGPGSAVAAPRSI